MPSKLSSKIIKEMKMLFVHKRLICKENKLETEGKRREN